MTPPVTRGGKAGYACDVLFISFHSPQGYTSLIEPLHEKIQTRNPVRRQQVASTVREQIPPRGSERHAGKERISF
jgi:hypothetical protein